jgi:hypothetical protein
MKMKLDDKRYIDNIKKALEKWGDAQRHARGKTNGKNFEKELSKLYSFASVVDTIDCEIQEFLNDRAEFSDTELKSGEDTFVVKKKTARKHKPFADEWRVLDDIKLSSLQMKETEQKLIDVLRLRAANYRGFISKIQNQIEREYLIFDELT